MTSVAVPERDGGHDWRRQLALALPELPGLQEQARQATGPAQTRLLLALQKLRRDRTRDDPLLFALVYLRHHLHSDETGGVISFSQFHLDLCDQARTWVDADPGPMENRSAWVAPRGSGKSTWTFLILPIWALAHGHRRFIGAFADSGAQAEQHLISLKMELDNNQLLRADYPDLCNPATRPAGTTVADNRGLYVADSGAVFMARGIDSSTLGAKLSNQRPDLLLFDDVEPDEANYSEYQKGKRLGTIVNAVFPMNDRAVVLVVGTVVMPGSLVHDLVRQVLDNPEDDQLPAWPVEENIRVHYYPALFWDDDGQPVSLWPERWAVDYLVSIQNTRSFSLNMQNDPVGREGGYWDQADIRYGVPDVVTKVFLWVDPPVTKKKTSDPCGLAFVGYTPPVQLRNKKWTLARATVFQAFEVRMTGRELARQTLKVIRRFEQDSDRRVGGVIIETNQGGDLWQEVFDPVLTPAGYPHLLYTASEPKEVRFGRALEYYQRKQVQHAARLSVLEQQQKAFPKGAHDDVVDAACAGILHFLEPKKGPPPQSRTEYPD